IPGGLVADTEHSLELVGANTLLGLTHDVGSHEPLPKLKVGVVEDGSGHDRELVTASVTVELIPLVHPRELLRATAGAAGALGLPVLGHGQNRLPRHPP